MPLELDDLRLCNSDFSCNEYCFCVTTSSICLQLISKVIVSCTDMYIPHSFSNTKTRKLWFTLACCRVVRYKKVDHREFYVLQCPETHYSYFLPRNARSDILDWPEILSSLEYNNDRKLK